MTPTTSMTRRLIIVLTSVMTAFWLLASGLGMIVMQDEFKEIFDSALQETGERLLPLVVDDLMQQDGISSPRRIDPAAMDREEEYLTYQVRDATGRVLLHSHDVLAAPFDAPLQRGFHDTPLYRIYTAASADGTIFVQIADAFANRREATVEGGFALLLPLLVLLPASIFAIRLIVRRMLSPVDDLRRAIGSKDSGTMAPVDEAPLPRELRPIARSVNLLLTRLRAALEAEREFTANSAHELRTPIAGALAQTQRLVEELSAGPTQTRARQIETSLNKLANLAEKLLQLSRAEAGIGSGDMVDLFPVLGVVIEDARRTTLGENRIRFASGSSTTLLRPVNADAFAILVRNLLENALLHSPAKSVVDIRLDPSGSIRIANAGPVLSRDELAAVTGRFIRGRTGALGSGLGLSIVTRLVDQMHGRLELCSPATGMADGFEAIVTI